MYDICAYVFHINIFAFVISIYKIHNHIYMYKCVIYCTCNIYNYIIVFINIYNNIHN